MAWQVHASEARRIMDQSRISTTTTTQTHTSQYQQTLRKELLQVNTIHVVFSCGPQPKRSCYIQPTTDLIDGGAIT